MLPDEATRQLRAPTGSPQEGIRNGTARPGFVDVDYSTPPAVPDQQIRPTHARIAECSISAPTSAVL